MSGLLLRRLVQELVQRGLRVFGDPQHFCGPSSLAFTFRRSLLGHWPLNDKMVPAPGIEPGWPCQRPRGCKPRTSASFRHAGTDGRSITASALDVGTGGLPTF